MIRDLHDLSGGKLAIFESILATERPGIKAFIELNSWTSNANASKKTSAV